MENVLWVPSPNYSKTRFGATIDRIVCHWIVGTLESADATFKNPASQVSAHFGVGDDDVHQYVLETDTAWHAGDWQMNNRSIGIEHEGGPNLPISDATYAKSAQLISELSVKYNIPLDRNHIIKHSEIVATACPGTLDIDRLISMAKDILNPIDPCKEIEEDRDYQKGEKEKYKSEARMLRDVVESQTQTIQEKGDQIESLQIDNTELRNDLTEARRNAEIALEQLEICVGQKDALETNLEALKGKYDEQATKLEQTTADLVKERTKNTKTLHGYSWWERFFSLFGSR